MLYSVASLPIYGMLLLNSVVPFGEGLEAWAFLSEQIGRFDFWIFMLASAVLLPPVYEEIAVRGYMLGRLRENFGPIGAVIVSSFLFMLSHGHFYKADAVALLSMATGIFAVICWGYVTVRTGTLLPAMVAHALFNLPIPREWQALLPVVLIQLIIIAVGRKIIAEYAVQFLADWRASDRKTMALGVALVMVFLVPILTLNAAGVNGVAVPLGVVWLVAALAISVFAFIRRAREQRA